MSTETEVSVADVSSMLTPSSFSTGRVDSEGVLLQETAVKQTAVRKAAMADALHSFFMSVIFYFKTNSVVRKNNKKL